MFTYAAVRHDNRHSDSNCADRPRRAIVIAPTLVRSSWTILSRVRRDRSASHERLNRFDLPWDARIVVGIDQCGHRASEQIWDDTDLGRSPLRSDGVSNKDKETQEYNNSGGEVEMNEYGSRTNTKESDRPKENRTRSCSNTKKIEGRNAHTIQPHQDNSWHSK
jgi:hypothetical protein